MSVFLNKNNLKQNNKLSIVRGHKYLTFSLIFNYQHYFVNSLLLVFIKILLML